MLQRLLALAHKEFIQIRRDRRTLAMMIALPVLWLVLFGYAFSFDVKEVDVAVLDESGTRTGAMVADAFRAYERFVVVELDNATDAGVRDAMYRDELAMAVIIPKGYPDSPDGLKVIIDGANIFAAQTGARLLQVALEPVQAQVAAAFAQSAGEFRLTPPELPQLIPELEVLYNPELKSANVMIPGLLGMVIMFMTTMMTAMGVVREREYGTMEQLVVTPIRPVELMLGKLLPYFLVAAVDFAIVFVAGMYLFDLKFMGNLPLFLGLSLLLVFTTLGLGLLLSTVAQNQQQAMQLALFAILPQMLLSGLIFPLSSLPKWVQYIAYALPFTHYVPVARGMFIKGQTFDLLYTETAILAVYAVVVVAVASLRFRKRIA
ncbi:MAG TPA: ABC transporter permease [Symbiobacteriaceae bacterium]|nr:ABC transporter permease [Symbiobacteriaceae bacterium]